MLLRNRLITGISGALVLMLLALAGVQEVVRAQTGTVQSQNRPAATPTVEQKAAPPAQLPEDVDVNDPALPLWLRPAAPVTPLGTKPPPPKTGPDTTAVTKDR